MIFEWHKKEAPFFTGITRAVGGAGFGKPAGGGGPRRSARPIIITMWGGAGGGWVRKAGQEWGPPSISGGTGAAMIATTTDVNLGLSSGDQLYIYVGGAGSQGGSGGPNGGHPGGGGGGSGGYGGGGGGMSSVYMKGSFSTGTLLLIAAGGSGGAGLLNICHLDSRFSANGGTQSSGGAGGPGVSGGGPGSPGSQFTGGGAGTHGGGGGAGYYGGGGGPGDGGAANGGNGGTGSCYINTSYFTEDTTDSGLANGVVIANIFRRFPQPFNPPMPFSGPSTAPYPFFPLIGYPGPYYFGPGGSTSSPFPGQNAGHPLYNPTYGGGSRTGSDGYPGSVHITFNGVTYSYTSVGPHVFTVP